MTKEKTPIEQIQDGTWNRCICNDCENKNKKKSFIHIYEYFEMFKTPNITGTTLFYVYHTHPFSFESFKFDKNKIPKELLNKAIIFEIYSQNLDSFKKFYPNDSDLTKKLEKEKNIKITLCSKCFENQFKEILESSITEKLNLVINYVETYKKHLERKLKQIKNLNKEDKTLEYEKNKFEKQLNKTKNELLNIYSLYTKASEIMFNTYKGLNMLGYSKTLKESWREFNQIDYLNNDLPTCLSDFIKFTDLKDIEKLNDEIENNSNENHKEKIIEKS